MNSPYKLMAKCQKRLLECDIKEIDKLNLEMNIIRTKIILLEYDWKLSKEQLFNIESDIETLYGKICDGCNANDDSIWVDNVVDGLKNIMESIKLSK